MSESQSQEHLNRELGGYKASVTLSASALVVVVRSQAEEHRALHNPNVRL